MKEFEFRRMIPEEDGYDVVVAGGGPAGCAAAVTASRMGAKVLLVEALGCLGGAGTSGLVTNMGQLGHGGQMLLGGFVRELEDVLYERGYFTGYVPSERKKLDYFVWQPFSPEGLKLVLDEFMEKAKVEVRFFTQVIDAQCDFDSLSVKGVVLSNVEGLSFVRAKAFIDCTGDAILADKCGVEFDRPTDPMPPTLMATLAGTNWEKIEPNLVEGQIKNQQKVVDQAVKDGFFTFPDRHIPGIFLSVGNLASLNAGHIFNMDALNCRSVSDGMVMGRRLVQEYLRFFKTYFEDFKDVELAATASMMGVRDSRRIKGEYCLCFEDYQNRRKFPDQICLNAQDVDLHVRNCSEEEYARFHEEFFETYHYGPGEYFGIPYGVMVPKGSDNLWVAGRTVSCDMRVHASIRMMPVCYTLGQAAGAAAVQAIEKHQKACELDTEELVLNLRKQGAILPQEELSKTMTRQ